MGVKSSAQVQFTRPSNTTQYTAGDAVSDDATTATIATFTLKGMAAISNGGGEIKTVLLHKTDQDLTGADFDVYLFRAAPSGANFEDNAAVALTDAEWQSCVNFVQFRASADSVSVNTGDLLARTNLNIHYGFGGMTTRDLYVVIVARGTYTPFAEEVFTLNISGEMD